MNKEIKEKRRFHRVFFSSEDGILGVFEFPAPYKGSATATIMDISQEGMGITFRKSDCPPVNKGDCIVLREIINMPSLAFMKNIEMEIRWVLSHRSLEHIALGCRLIDVGEEITEQLKKVIASWSIKIRL